MHGRSYRRTNQTVKPVVGVASDVPELIRSLTNPDPKVRSKTMWTLYGNVFHQGTRFPATPYVVPFLIELSASPPVRKKLSVSHDFPIPERSRLAGQTALAHRTDISKGDIKSIAIDPSVEKECRAELARFCIPDDESERSITVELLRYDPCPLSQDASVDPLSLYLSMQDIRDERVEAALDDLLKGMTW